VVVTSAWTGERLHAWYGLPTDRIHVAHPGVDTMPLSTRSGAGDRLLCVAAVAPHKGHDLLVDALAMAGDLRWRCTCVGSIDRDPQFVRQLRVRLEQARLAGRVDLVGAHIGSALDRYFANADLFVLASRGETYGMVLAEALARGIPVLATDVGGVREALGEPAGQLPGLLVAPDDVPALAAALRCWLDEPELRSTLRAAAVDRRATLPSWAATTDLVAAALVAAATSNG
jgi:glycosyltransferase involved in cell wall biosynthesis